eukprot:8036923-Pyramimonas_sp.AAC.1
MEHGSPRGATCAPAPTSGQIAQGWGAARTHAWAVPLGAAQGAPPPGRPCGAASARGRALSP